MVCQEKFGFRALCPFVFYRKLPRTVESNIKLGVVRVRVLG